MQTLAVLLYLVSASLAVVFVNWSGTSSQDTRLSLAGPVGDTSEWPADIGFSNLAELPDRTADEPVSAADAWLQNLGRQKWQAVGNASTPIAPLFGYLGTEPNASFALKHIAVVRAFDRSGDRPDRLRSVTPPAPYEEAASPRTPAPAGPEMQANTAPRPDAPEPRRISDETLRQAYGAMDAGGDGTVSREEWLSWEGGGLSRFLAVDTDDDDRLSYDEYRQSVADRYGVSRLSN